MGAIGKYIDMLSDEAADRVLMGQDWCADTFMDERGARCLVGHAGGFRRVASGAARECDTGAVDLAFAIDWKPLTPPARFDRLVYRVGIPRAVALVKARAAKRTRLTLDAPALVTTPAPPDRVVSVH